MSEKYNMKGFGSTLTDRSDGKKAYKQITVNDKYPDMLDFSGVMSLGSSFGDEVLPKLAEKNNCIIKVSNANQAIKSCIKKVIEDSKIEFEVIYLD